MSDNLPDDALALASWRRAVAELYSSVRNAADPNAACDHWRRSRDRLVAAHRVSPLSEDARTHFTALNYFPYDPEWRCEARCCPPPDGENRVEMDGGRDGIIALRTIATLAFSANEREATLPLYQLEGYGGGLFLPFRDATSGRETYAGGRYLLDTIKGADLGMRGDRIVLDFNFAYYPSCAYNPQWVCPLPGPDSTLPFDVRAGECGFSR